MIPWADDLDAAHRREVDALNEQIADLRQQRDLWSKRAAELVEKCNEQYAKLKQVGDAAKLREALVSVQKKIHYLIGSLNVPNSLVANRMEINGIINAALAAPARNCDVGTPEEQAKRLHRFCISQDCVTCPCDRGKADGRCEFAWMQMPYEEVGENDKFHAANSIMGRESINKQCYECANCGEPTAGWDGSKFRCAFLGKDFNTWHYDVPNECPCKGKGWKPKTEGGAE